MDDSRTSLFVNLKSIKVWSLYLTKEESRIKTVEEGDGGMGTYFIKVVHEE